MKLLTVAVLGLVSATQAASSTSRSTSTSRSSSISHTKAASTTSAYPSRAPTVTIDAGVLHGTTTSLPAAIASINKFLGVPFAQSPPERFSSPQRPGKFKEPINATAWSPACIQQFVYPKNSQQFTELVFNTPAPEESEDCLYLEVYAPSTPAPADRRAAMLWIYGGSLQSGNTGQPTYDGSWFASYEDVIVVSANYRTNVICFPSSPELPVTGHNLGFLDQRFGLEQGHHFSESEGAFSVDALLTSFPANSSPPFRGATLESGQYSYRAAPVTSQVPAWDALSAALGCPGSYSSNLTCVRAAKATTIQQIIDEQVLEFNPTPDNVTLVANPAKQRLSGDIAHLPVMGGTNAQEGRVFTVGQNDTQAYLTGLFGNETALITAIEATYPIGAPGLNTVYDRLSAIFTDLVFQCPAAKWAERWPKVVTPC